MAEPSRYFRQHYAVDAPVIDDAQFRPYWRVRTHLDGLLHDGAITPVEWRAAQVFRSIAETVLSASWSTSNWLDSTNSGGGFDVGLAARHDAIARLNELHRELGGFAIDLLEAHLVDDVPWIELGRRLDVHAKTARAWTVVVVRALAAAVWKK